MIIFVDIDGVFQLSSYINYLVKNNMKTKDKHGQLFDTECIKNFNEIIDITGADVVITSSWRFNGLISMKKLWKARGLKGNIIGITTIGAPFEFDCRGQEIERWFMDNGKPSKFVIIDDCNIGDYYNKEFVKTNTKTGITSKIKDIIIEKLNYHMNEK